MRRSFRATGLVFVPAPVLGGRPRILHRFHEEQLLLYLKQRPGAYLDEMVFFLWDEYVVVIDEGAVDRAIHRLLWSRKQCKRRAAQRSAELRNHWMAKVLAVYHARQLTFLDESAADERTGVCTTSFYCLIY